jgi:PIN domain nuclease of toxin-antitoxin system
MDAAIESGQGVGISSITLVEATYLLEKGRIDKQAFDSLVHVATAPDVGYELVPLDIAIALALRQISPSALPDMPDRIIAATALALDVPLVTRDLRIRATHVATIW